MPFPNISLCILLLVFSLLVVPLIVFGSPVAATYTFHNDVVLAHLPQINYFISHPFGISHYPATAAMTPGHHLLLAWISILFGYSSVDEGTWIIRLVNAAMGYGALIVAWLIVRRLGVSGWKSAALVLPIACSNYVITSAVWILTDDAGLLLYALTLFGVLLKPRNPWLAGIVGALLVLWRQVYLPVLGVYTLAAAYLGRNVTRRDIVSAAAALVPATLIIGYFYMQWGALTPPDFRSQTGPPLNPYVLLHSLALVGLFAFPFGITLLRATLALDWRHLVIAGSAFIVVVAVLWLAGPSNYDNTEGRWGSLIWLLSRHGPVIGERSVVVLALGALGGTALATMLVHAKKNRYFPAATAMLLLYFVAYSAQVMAWQRYLEPHIMLTFAVFCARVGDVRLRDLAGRLRWLPCSVPCRWHGCTDLSANCSANLG